MNRPSWRVNMCGLRGAVGYRDVETGKPIILVNGWGLYVQYRYGVRRSVSLKHIKEDFSKMVSDEPVEDRHED